MRDHQLAIHPVGKTIQPTRPAMEKEQRKTDAEKQKPLENLEDCNDLEIANAPALPFHGFDRCLIAHSDTSRRSISSSQAGRLSREQISSLFPLGSSKKTA